MQLSKTINICIHPHHPNHIRVKKIKPSVGEVLLKCIFIIFTKNRCVLGTVRFKCLLPTFSENESHRKLTLYCTKKTQIRKMNEQLYAKIKSFIKKYAHRISAIIIYTDY